ncbi:MAG TPA: RNA-binding protein [Geobacteraceae bacterium]|nr:RNA-binding protein [Geobacteraceae bacterium]
MGNRIFVGNLSWETTEGELSGLFSGAGQVASVRIVTDKFTRQPKGFAFVEMATDEDAAKAISLLNGTMLRERALTVNEAHPPKDRDERGQGRGGGKRGQGSGGRQGGHGGGRWER